MHNIITVISQNVFLWRLPQAQRLIELTTASLTIIQLLGSRVLGGIFYCSQMCRVHYILNMSGSISVSLIFTYSLMIQHGTHKYDHIMTIAKHAYRYIRWYIKNNAWVTVNNDFGVTSDAICQWFSRVTKSRVKIIGKLHHEWPKNRYSR